MQERDLTFFESEKPRIVEHTHTHTYLHTYTHIHTFIHIHTHIYTFTYYVALDKLLHLSGPCFLTCERDNLPISWDCFEDCQKPHSGKVLERSKRTSEWFQSFNATPCPEPRDSKGGRRMLLCQTPHWLFTCRALSMVIGTLIL